MKTNKTEIEQTKTKLKNLIEKSNRIIYQQVLGVSPSGMSRYIKSFVIIDNEPYVIDYLIAKILTNVKRKQDKDGLFISGCGMDMGFSIVYSLGSILYPKGDGKTITGRNGSKKPETDGGYLLNQRWL